MNVRFLFYSYIYINCQQNDALVYNTISQQVFVVTNKIILDCLNEIAFYPTSYYIISICEDNVDSDVRDILSNLENNFCGEIIWNENLPIQLSPRILIKEHDIEIYDGNKENIENYVSDIEEYNDHIGRNILSNVLEMTIHYSTLSIFRDINKYGKAFLQYHFPKIGDREVLTIDALKRLFSCDLPNLERINLVIGTVLDKDINELVKNVFPILIRHTKNIFLYISLSDYEKIESYIDIQLANVYIWCHPLQNMNNKYLSANVSVTSLVTSDDDVSYLETNFDNSDYYPLYTGENNEYCVNELSFSIEEVVSIGCTEKNVVQNKHVNSNFWGELTVLPNGDIYSCVNCKRLGNILHDSMRFVMWNEFVVSKNWFMSRKKMTTCVNCKYNWLCPPVTNIELALGNWTLCK